MLVYELEGTGRSKIFKRKRNKYFRSKVPVGSRAVIQGTSSPPSAVLTSFKRISKALVKFKFLCLSCYFSYVILYCLILIVYKVSIF